MNRTLSKTFRLPVMHYVLKDLSIDIEARAVCRDDTAIKLPDLSFDAFVRY